MSGGLAEGGEAGEDAASSAADAVSAAEVVISMLPASRHVEGLYLGDAGLFSVIAPGSLVLECSTIAPAAAGGSMAHTPALSLAALRFMKKEYGDKKGESVFYASKNAGKIKTKHYLQSVSPGHMKIGRASCRERVSSPV